MEICSTFEKIKRSPPYCRFFKKPRLLHLSHQTTEGRGKFHRWALQSVGKESETNQLQYGQTQHHQFITSLRCSQNNPEWVWVNVPCARHFSHDFCAEGSMCWWGATPFHINPQMGETPPHKPLREFSLRVKWMIRVWLEKCNWFNFFKEHVFTDLKINFV